MATDCQQLFLAPLAQIQGKLDIQTWAGLIVAILATAYLFMRSKAKARKDPLARQQTGSSLAQQRAVERQMSNLLVELSEMARAVSAGLDTRAAKLQVLIDEADQRIAQLKALGAAPHQHVELPPTQAPQAPTMRIVSDGPREVAASDPHHDQVYQLADLGKSPHEIAVMVGKPRGEIELILALRTRKAADG
jgi:hypothetical protein